MERSDLVVIGSTTYVITDVRVHDVVLAPLSHPAFDEIVVPKDRVLAVGIYRRVDQ